MKWYYQQDGREVGPIAEKALRELASAGILSAQALVRREDRSEWRPLEQSLEESPPPVEGSDSGPQNDAVQDSTNSEEAAEPPPAVPASHRASPALQATDEEQSKPSTGQRLKSGARAGWLGIKRLSKQASLKAQIEKLRNVDLRKAHHSLGRKCLELGLLEVELAETLESIRDVDATIAMKKEKTAADTDETRMAALKRMGKDAANTSHGQALRVKREHLITELGKQVCRLDERAIPPELKGEVDSTEAIEDQIQTRTKELEKLAFGKNNRLPKVLLLAAVLLVVGVIAWVRSGGPTDEGRSSAADEFESTTAGKLPPLSEPIPQGFSLIPAGEFVMGDALDDMEDAPAHVVTLSAFYIGKHEVTQGLWQKVREWSLRNGYPDLPEGEGSTDNHPAYRLNWYDAVKWCNARSEMDGLDPCYKLSGAIYRKGEPDSPEYGSLECDFSANGYRLPTEAEWEKAARGGKHELRFPSGDTISHWKANYTARYNSYPYQEKPTLTQALDEDLTPRHQSDYMDIASGKVMAGRNSATGEDRSYRHHKTTGVYPFHIAVGQFPPNGYGLYDMAGNASEWCWDSFAKDYYTRSPQLNPIGPDNVFLLNGMEVFRARVHRGGSGVTPPSTCRVAARSFDNEENLTHGFRVVRR